MSVYLFFCLWCSLFTVFLRIDSLFFLHDLPDDNDDDDDDDDDGDDDDDDDDNELLCGIAHQQKAFSHISTQDSCQWFSQSDGSDTP